MIFGEWGFSEQQGAGALRARLQGRAALQGPAALQRSLLHARMHAALQSQQGCRSSCRSPRPTRPCRAPPPRAAPSSEGVSVCMCMCTGAHGRAWGGACRRTPALMPRRATSLAAAARRLPAAAAHGRLRRTFLSVYSVAMVSSHSARHGGWRSGPHDRVQAALRSPPLLLRRRCCAARRRRLPAGHCELGGPRARRPAAGGGARRLGKQLAKRVQITCREGRRAGLKSKTMPWSLPLSRSTHRGPSGTRITRLSAPSALLGATGPFFAAPAALAIPLRFLHACLTALTPPRLPHSEPFGFQISVAAMQLQQRSGADQRGEAGVVRGS